MTGNPGRSVQLRCNRFFFLVVNLICGQDSQPHAQKGGHTGALDPLATGMLPICLGEATKFSQFLLDADKTYRVNACFGIRTDTSDSTGNVISRSRVHFSESDLMKALEHFTGRQKQVPSMYSALKYQGKHYYDYARAGIEIPREARDIVIYRIELLSFDGTNALMAVAAAAISTGVSPLIFRAVSTELRSTGSILPAKISLKRSRVSVLVRS